MATKRASKLKSFSVYIVYLLTIIIVFDAIVFKWFLGFGYPRHYEEDDIRRYPAPYVMFKGKPNTYDHNEAGFRGSSFKNSDANDLKIAFFGGSTGYFGEPPIAMMVEKKLAESLNISVFVANYSVSASNHRQHLHGITEFLPQFKPDIIIFYGGYNETINNAFYDPRPGYPYNFFYRSETSPLLKLLLENSAIIGVVDKNTGAFSGLKKLRIEHQPFSGDWNRKIAEKYFETLELANNITGTIESDFFGKTKFLAFYQPFRVPEEFMSTHNKIKHHISTLTYAFDVSLEYDSLGEKIYTDSVHVKQRANEVMGAKIAEIVANEFQKAAVTARKW
jgi:hypothetical protein